MRVRRLLVERTRGAFGGSKVRVLVERLRGASGGSKVKGFPGATAYGESMISVRRNIPSN